MMAVQPRALLDTDTISALMRGHPAVTRQTRAKRAVRQLETFDQFCATCVILPLTDEIVVKAAEIYAELREQGEPIGDGDILIAASALVSGLSVVTNNEDHFRRVLGLSVENWLQPQR